MAEHLLSPTLDAEPGLAADTTVLAAEAAVAEAWSVDGLHEAAAERFGKLARAGFQPARMALGAGVSCQALGRVAAAERWLAEAKASGVAEEELFWVEARRLCRQGHPLQALDAFRPLLRRPGHTCRALNAIGVLCRQLGMPERARAHFRAVLERQPHDAEALVNEVSLDLESGDPAELEAKLDRAALGQPHRPEPYDLHACLLRRFAGADAGRASETKSRLRLAHRLRPLGEVPLALPGLAEAPGVLRCPPGDEWLGEALLEHSRQLAEGAGSRARGVADLAERAGELDASARRRKGGFLISMLRQVMGEPGFDRLLGCVHRLGRTHWIDTYTFAALASSIHGRPLFWFFNQWLHCDASMSFHGGPCDVVAEPAGYELTVPLVCRGIATPGAPVEVSVRTEDGTVERLQAGLELGACTLRISLRSRPIHVAVDPDVRWYASRTEVRLCPEP